MPCIETLTIKCCNPLSDLVYLNIYQWIKLIELLHNLKRLVLILISDKNIKETAWNRHYEQLMNLMSSKRIVLRIITCNEHKI